jgi:hypothetical protein
MRRDFNKEKGDAIPSGESLKRRRESEKSFFCLDGGGARS